MVAVAAFFQKDPSVLIAHPGQGDDALAALKGKPIMIGSDTRVTAWLFLKQKFGYTDDQIRPYTFSAAPFLADPKAIQQGYLTSEPFTIEKAGVEPKVFLLADLGYPPYSQVLIVSRDTLAKRGDALARFVQASAEGWKSYLANPAPGNALIRKANPQMTDALMAYGYRKMKEYRLVDGGDAQRHGLLSMTDAHWQSTVAFMRDAGIAKAGVDYTRAWTTALSHDTHVLP